MAKDEGLLSGIQAGKHAAEGGRAADARKNGVDVLLVVQQAADLRADLRQHLVVNSARPLVDNQQCDIVLTQFASDRAEYRLAGELWSKAKSGLTTTTSVSWPIDFT